MQAGHNVSAGDRGNGITISWSCVIHDHSFWILYAPDNWVFGHVIGKERLEALRLIGKMKGQRARSRQRQTFVSQFEETCCRLRTTGTNRKCVPLWPPMPRKGPETKKKSGRVFFTCRTEYTFWEFFSFWFFDRCFLRIWQPSGTISGPASSAGGKRFENAEIIVWFKNTENTKCSGVLLKCFFSEELPVRH